MRSRTLATACATRLAAHGRRRVHLLIEDPGPRGGDLAAKTLLRPPRDRCDGTPDRRPSARLRARPRRRGVMKAADARSRGQEAPQPLHVAAGHEAALLRAGTGPETHKAACRAGDWFWRPQSNRPAYRICSPLHTLGHEAMTEQQTRFRGLSKLDGQRTRIAPTWKVVLTPPPSSPKGYPIDWPEKTVKTPRVAAKIGHPAPHASRGEAIAANRTAKAVAAVAAHTRRALDFTKPGQAASVEQGDTTSGWPPPQIQSAMWKIGVPSQLGPRRVLSGVTANSRHSSAPICTRS